MTDHDRNMRTLIVCFVLAMVALVPLRMVEVRNIVGGEVRVLGETEELVVDDNQYEETYEVNEESGEYGYGEEVIESDSDSEVEEIVLPDVGGLN